MSTIDMSMPAAPTAADRAALPLLGLEDGGVVGGRITAARDPAAQRWCRAAAGTAPHSHMHLSAPNRILRWLHLLWRLRCPDGRKVGGGGSSKYLDAAASTKIIWTRQRQRRRRLGQAQAMAVAIWRSDRARAIEQGRE